MQVHLTTKQSSHYIEIQASRNRTLFERLLLTLFDTLQKLGMNSDEPIDNTGSAVEKSDALRSHTDSTSPKSYSVNNAAQKSLTSSDNQTNNDQSVQKVSLSDEDMKNIDKDHLVDAWHKQLMYIENLEQRLAASDSRDAGLITRIDSDDKLKQQLLESTRRENILLMRLARKEQEMQVLMVCTCRTNIYVDLVDCSFNILFLEPESRT